MKPIVLIAFLSIAALAQEKSHPFDCPTGSNTSPGCTSFSEMVAKNDKDILAIFARGDAFVCFRPDEDTFISVTFDNPEDGEFSRGKTGHLQAGGLIVYSKYEKGILNDFQMAFGSWNKFSDTQKIPTFAAPTKNGVSGTIDDTEVVFNDEFKNRATTVTKYSLTIRRSTLRFIESFDWDDAQAVHKGKIAATPSHNHTEVTGYCAEFK